MAAKPSLKSESRIVIPEVSASITAPPSASMNPHQRFISLRYGNALVSESRNFITTLGSGLDPDVIELPKTQAKPISRKSRRDFMSFFDPLSLGRERFDDSPHSVTTPMPVPVRCDRHRSRRSTAVLGYGHLARKRPNRRTDRRR